MTNTVDSKQYKARTYAAHWRNNPAFPEPAIYGATITNGAVAWTAYAYSRDDALARCYAGANEWLAKHG